VWGIIHLGTFLVRWGTRDRKRARNALGIDRSSALGYNSVSNAESKEAEVSNPKKDPPRMIKGLRIHRDVDWDYSFMRPAAWARHDMDDQYGFIYSPEGDPRTGFYVSVMDLSAVLDEPVSETDLPALHEGILEGLGTLPDCQVLEEKEIAKGFALGFEFVLTFSLDGETVKRRMWLLYNDRQQFTIYGQGASISEYDVYHDTFGMMYSSFTFGDILAMGGVSAPPQTETHWEGRGKGVQTRPHTSRDHSKWLASKIEEADKKIEGA
jgi:hypothetical protein